MCQFFKFKIPNYLLVSISYDILDSITNQYRELICTIIIKTSSNKNSSTCKIKDVLSENQIIKSTETDLLNKWFSCRDLNQHPLWMIIRSLILVPIRINAEIYPQDHPHKSRITPPEIPLDCAVSIQLENTQSDNLAPILKRN